MSALTIAYDDDLLKWRLGKGHPTNPLRARNAVSLLEKRGVELDVQAITRKVSDDELAYVHDREYIRMTGLGFNDEWVGKQPGLGKAARHMFAGTAQLVDQVLEGSLTYGFSPQGAKHHAMYDRGSGFCVYADWAYAALRLADAGHRVFVIDTDAHHGDGTEALTRHSDTVLTASVHDSTIFPGTGHEHDLDACVLNYPLPAKAGNRELLSSVFDALQMADEFDPTVVLFAIGGDGYVDDPLSSLEYTYAGYEAVASAVGSFVGLRDIPIVMGGAGGYLPHTATPRVWATVVQGVYEMAERVRQYDVHDVAEVV